MFIRISASIILLFSILFLPFYVSIIIAIAGMIYFPFFFEAVILLFILDLLHGVRESSLLYINSISLFVSVFFILIIELLKKKMRSRF